MKELKIRGLHGALPGGELWVSEHSSGVSFLSVVQRGGETGGSGLLGMGEGD